MKLKNKRTGEVVVEINKIGLVWNKYGMPAEIGQYDSIAELCEEWEDYEPREPNYICEYVACICPKCHKEIALKVYVKANDSMIASAELCGEEEAPEPIEPTFVDLDERIKEKEEG